MTSEQRLLELKELITPYVEDKENLEFLSLESDFIKDLKVNSANLVDIVLDIEEKYNIEIDTISMENMTDVKSALQIIEKKLAEK
jgi:acyl carrier protein